MTGSEHFQSFIQPQTTAVVRRAEDKMREQFSVADFGAVGDGATDDSAAINKAILALIAAGGGILNLQNGKNYLCKALLALPTGFNGIILDGHGAKITRGADMPAGQGLFDLQGAQGVTFRDLVVDGAVTVSVGITYASFGGDPNSPVLTQNTSFWLHGGCSDIDFDHLTLQHSGGYGIYLDTTGTTGNISRVRVLDSKFLNNRPHLFGIGVNIYGSWTGGIFYSGNCATAAPTANYVVQNLTVVNCIFERNTGNQVWGHCNGYNNFHSGIIVANNSFLDIGLDCIQISCTIGGCVNGNTGRRVGYICTDDASQSVPRYLPGVNASFIDHSGYVEAVNMSDNTCTSVCGGFCSLDGYAYGAVTGNSFRQPMVGDAFYVEDQIALIPAGVVYGFDCANTYGNVGGITEQGGSSIAIIGNAMYNCTAGAIIGIALRNCKIADNDIWSPPNPTNAPILLGNQSMADYQQCYGNSITGNRIYWSPATNRAAIIESETWSGGSIPWLAGEANWIEKNHILDTVNTPPKAFEVSIAPSSSSFTGWQISSNQPNMTAPGYISFQRNSAADGTSGYLSMLGTAGTEYFRFTDAGALIVNGNYGTGFFGFGFNSSSDLNGAGTCSTAGTAVTWTGGPASSQFTAAMVGDYITIAGALYTVATFTDATHISLTVSAGVGSGKAFQVGSALRTYLGNVLVTGSGFAFFKNAVVSVTFNSTADVSASPATTAAFQTSTGTCIVYGSGNAAFQSVAMNFLSLTAQAADVTAPGAGFAFLEYNSVIGALRYNLGGAGWVSIGGAASTVAGANTQVQFNKAGVFGASSHFTWDNTNNILAVTGTAGVSGIQAVTFSSSATGATAAVAVGSNAFIYGNGQVSAAWLTLTNGSPPASAAGFAFLSASSTALALSLNGGTYFAIPTVTATTVANQVAFYNSATQLTGKATMTFATDILTLSGAAGTGVIAPLFNANAGGTNLEYQGSNFSVTGQGKVATNGWLDFGGRATVSAPALSAAGHLVMYYDTTLQATMLSMNGVAFQQLIDQNGTWRAGAIIANGAIQTGIAGVSAGLFYIVDTGLTLQTGYTGTVASAAGKNVVGGLIVN